jgi:methionyl-tRNA formyltransferase
MRLIFFGTSEFAIPSLKRLSKEHELLFVITIPDRPKGRGYKLAPSPIKEEAQKLSIPVFSVQHPLESVERIKAARPKVCVTVAYGGYIPPALLKIPEVGFLNLHPSLLPKYRGPAPIRRAIMEGEKEFGVSVHFLDERVDAGDVLLQKKMEFDEEKDWGFISYHLSLEGASVLSQSLSLVEEGQFKRNKQKEHLATYAPKIKKEDCRIDWRMEAKKIHDLVRALSPYPGAYTFWRRKMMKVYRTSYENIKHSDVAGKVLCAHPKKGFVISCKDGVIYIMMLQLEGGKKMPSSQFLLGHKVEVGESLG